MDTLDLIVLTAAVAAAVGGWRLGLIARALSWVGLAVGLVVAAKLLPPTVRAFRDADQTTRLLLVATLLVGGAFLGQALGLLVGAQFHRVLPIGPLRVLDRTLGLIAALLGVFVALWAMLPSLKGVEGWPAAQAHNSAIADVIERLFPKPPDALASLERLVGDSNFAKVFKDDRAAANVGPPPVASGLAADVEARVRLSTVKVSGLCGHREQEGSGFAVGPDLVVTNAHVVAGERRTDVRREDGKSLSAVVVAFDSDRDLALLRVNGLHAPALSITDGHEGQTGAVFGHPGGSPTLRVAPAKIAQRVDAVGRNLYDSHDTRRDVFILASDLHPGDSGAALVDTSGVVLGVAFAIAPDRPQTAYALTSKELRAALTEVHAGAVSTGSCLSGG